MVLSFSNRSAKREVAAREAWLTINNRIRDSMDQSRNKSILDTDRNKFAAYQVRNIAGSNNNFNVFGYASGPIAGY